jgi:outer membrane protein assembly factor BamA
VSLAGGIMNPIKGGTKLNIMDKFFLGGPLTFRGFQIKGTGPHEDGRYLVLTSLHSLFRNAFLIAS